MAYPWAANLFIPIALILPLEIDPILKGFIGFFAGAALWIYALLIASFTLIVWLARIAAPKPIATVMGIPAACILVLFSFCTVIGALVELFFINPRNPHHHYSPVFLIWPCVLLFAALFLLWYDRTNVA